MLSAHWTQFPQHHNPYQQHHHFPKQVEMMDAMGIDPHAQPHTRRKRKADAQPENNERLSKRLSLLNLEHGGPKLYVPVENADAQPTAPPSCSKNPMVEDDVMQLDESKHKVYIYNLDDELSSESEPEDGRLLFLPDIEKHLRKNRIPAQVLQGPEADPAGMALVLYGVPRSISVPEEKDSVRKVILEARARAREKQEAERTAAVASPNAFSASRPTGPMGLSVSPEYTNGWGKLPTGLPRSSTQINTSPDSDDEMDLD